VKSKLERRAPARCYRQRCPPKADTCADAQGGRAYADFSQNGDRDILEKR